MGLFDMIVSELKNVLLPINSHNNSRISMNNAATQENVHQTIMTKLLHLQNQLRNTMSR